MGATDIKTPLDKVQRYRLRFVGHGCDLLPVEAGESYAADAVWVRLSHVERALSLTVAAVEKAVEGSARLRVRELETLIAAGACTHCVGFGVAKGRVEIRGETEGTCSACDGQGTGKAQLAALAGRKDEGVVGYTGPATQNTLDEPRYPCAECGKLRTKAEGGECLTTCEGLGFNCDGTKSQPPAARPPTASKLARLEAVKTFGPLGKSALMQPDSTAGWICREDAIEAARLDFAELEAKLATRTKAIDQATPEEASQS